MCGMSVADEETNVNRVEPNALRQLLETREETLVYFLNGLLYRVLCRKHCGKLCCIVKNECLVSSLVSRKIKQQEN